jgi:hypothetical protein
MTNTLKRYAPWLAALALNFLVWGAAAAALSNLPFI